MAEHTFNIKQGATWAWELSGFNYDISNNTYKMNIRVGKNKDTDLILDVTPYFTLTEDKISCAVPSAITKELDFTTGYYDLFEIDESGTVNELLSGCVKLEYKITDLGDD
jgi:hypothetical protein